MNKLYSIKSNSISDLTKRKTMAMLQSATLKKNLIQEYLGGDFDVRLDTGIVVVNNNTDILIKSISADTDNLIYIIDSSGYGVVSESGSMIIQNNDIEEWLVSHIFLVIMQAIELEYMIKSRSVKLIKGKSYTKIINKKSKAEYTLYDALDDDNLYTINLSNNKCTITSNLYSKVSYAFPEELYPLPNKSDIHVFHKGNTEEIKTNHISDILTGSLFKAGYCYSNADEIITLLNNSDFEGTAEFYSGWLLYHSARVHHAWVVIDGKYIIDTAYPLGKDMTELCYDNLSKGIAYIPNREEMARSLYDLMTSNKPFREKYNYGFIPSKHRLYVGVKSNSLEARQSFNSLLERHPEHPEYQNINKQTGENQTLKLAHSMLGSS